MPLISVIIPLFNKGPYIERTIRSVLQQTFQDFEIVVVDDNSTDEGPSVVKNIDDNRIVFFTTKGHGVSQARNKGVFESTSDFICFLDADDEWLPEHLDTLYNLLQNFPEAGLYSTNYIIKKQDGRIMYPRFSKIPFKSGEGLLDRFFMSMALGDAPLMTSSFGIRKDVFNDCRGYMEGLEWAEDHHLWGKVALRYPVAFTWKITAVWHQDVVNSLSKKTPPDMIEPVYWVVKEFIAHHEVTKEKKRELRIYLANKELDYAIRSYQNGNVRRALGILLHCSRQFFIFKRILWILICLLPPKVYVAFKIAMRNKL